MKGVVRVGVLGAGQLGRMLALAARPLGIGMVALDPAEDAPAGTVAEVWRGAYDDPALLARMERTAEAVTFEFENVPPAALERLARTRPVWPSPRALAEGRDRLREKALFRRVGLPVPAHRALADRHDLAQALTELGGRAVVKTRYGGFDGRGQAVLSAPPDEATWAALSSQPLLAEAFVPFRRELSLVAARGADGATAFYPLVENLHREGVLRLTLAPAPSVEPALEREVRAAASRLMEHLEYVGVLALELFDLGPDAPGPSRWLANEMAPRVHNTGHWTIEGAETSQFENHLRAGLGWPLGRTDPRGATAMLNLLGSVPEPKAVLGVPGAHLHHYEKAARPARKLGHVTVTAPDADALAQRLRRLAAAVPALAEAALHGVARLDAR